MLSPRNRAALSQSCDSMLEAVHCQSQPIDASPHCQPLAAHSPPRHVAWLGWGDLPRIHRRTTSTSAGAQDPPLPGFGSHLNVWHNSPGRQRLDLCSSGTGGWRNPGTVSQGPFRGQVFSGSAWGRSSVEPRFSNCAGSPSGGGHLPLKSMALPALGTGTLSKGDAGQEEVALTRDRKFL